MPDFSYKASDGDGTIIKGVRFAQSEDELATYLHRGGLQLLQSRKTRLGFLHNIWDFLRYGGISRRDLIDFSNNMGVMLRAGVPLVHCLTELREDIGNRYFKKILGELVDDITSGDSLNQAMARAPRVFPDIYVNIISIGEESGMLDKVFFDLARHYKRLDDLILQTRKAIIYPLFVLVALVLVTYVYLSVVFPLLFTLLEEFDAELPAITLAIQSVSNFMQTKWEVIFFVLVLLFVLYILFRRTRPVRYALGWCELNFPGINKIFIQMRMAFFMRYMSMLLGAGVDLIKGMDLSINSINNIVMQEILTECLLEVTGGAMISESFRGRKVIPNMVVRMISVGEEAGLISQQMEYVADQYEEDLSRRISWAFEVMGPLVIFLLAGMALILIMGVLLPVYDLVNELSAQGNRGF
jgi:type II secretory pathway component PulF